jgi:hypothetical protein
MTAATSHRLDGLEPDNLLAFLALLGLLRALDIARPEWRSRAYWNVEAAPLRPILTTQEPTTPEGVSRSALEGLLVFRDALRPFSWPRSSGGTAKKAALVSDRSRQRTLSKRCVSALSACTLDRRKRLLWQLRCDLVSVSGSRRTERRKGEAFDTTPMKLPSGQMTFIGAQFDTISICDADDISRSLFYDWVYGHQGSSLRFAPGEARRYAYRASDPSPEGARTELGASALSGLGLLAFTMSEAHPYWRMVAYTGSRVEGHISWPIWSAAGGPGASLQTIVAMLRALTPEKHQHASIRNSVHMIATARRYVLDPSQGDYGNFSRARFSFP